MKKVYFDTEFTGLMANAKLISIGLIEDNGESEFYAEIKEGYTKEECSQFCKEQVLVHLEGGKFERTHEQLKNGLRQWIENFHCPVLLVCDNKKDKQQLRILYPEGLPINAKIHVMGWWENLKRKYKNRNNIIYLNFALRPHHALDDAKANRQMFSKYIY